MVTRNHTMLRVATARIDEDRVGNDGDEVEEEDTAKIEDRDQAGPISENDLPNGENNVHDKRDDSDDDSDDQSSPGGEVSKYFMAHLAKRSRNHDDDDYNQLSQESKIERVESDTEPTKGREEKACWLSSKRACPWPSPTIPNATTVWLASVLVIYGDLVKPVSVGTEHVSNSGRKSKLENRKMPSQPQRITDSKEPPKRCRICYQNGRNCKHTINPAEGCDNRINRNNTCNPDLTGVGTTN
jgi:hypothetical protein